MMETQKIVHEKRYSYEVRVENLLDGGSLIRGEEWNSESAAPSNCGAVPKLFKGSKTKGWLRTE
jgi:hypothetical protein